jgi:hypothetical protein
LFFFPLLESGTYWEASTIFKLLLNVCEPKPDTGELAFNKAWPSIRHANEEDECPIIARLSIANAYLEYRLRNFPALSGDGEMSKLLDLRETAKGDLFRLFPGSFGGQTRHHAKYVKNLARMEALEATQQPKRAKEVR